MHRVYSGCDDSKVAQGAPNSVSGGLAIYRVSVQQELPADTHSSSPPCQNVKQGGLAGTRGAQNGEQAALSAAAIIVTVCGVCSTGDA